MTESGPDGPDESPAPLKPLPGAVAFLGMGMSAAGCVAVGVVLGLMGDREWHTSPLFFLIGLFLGLAAAVASVVAQIRRFL
jgi:F0F1-type ATP synthase assembly protein I